MGNCITKAPKKKEEDESSSSSDSGGDSSGEKSSKTTKEGDSDSGYESSDDGQDAAVVTKYKFLLVGAGEAGKSTFFKLVTNKSKGMFQNSDDRLEFRDSIRENVIEAFKTIIATCEKLGAYRSPEGADFDCRISDSLADDLELLMGLEPDEIDESACEAMKKLLNDAGFNTVLKNLRHLFYMPDGSDYYFDKLEGICDENYVPDFEDVLYCRDRTTGVTHEELPYKCGGSKIVIDLYDVGGQRAERKAWRKIFDNVHCIIFVMPVSEFDQTCFEDSITNRSIESLTVLRVLNDSPSFEKTPIMILLTKVDQLQKKLASGRVFKLEKPNNDELINFKEYAGGNNFEEVTEFLKEICLLQITGKKKVVLTFKNLVEKNVDFDDEFQELLKAVEKNENEKKT